MSTEKAKLFEAVTDEFSRATRWASKLTQSKDNALVSVKIANSVMTMSAYNGINSSKSKSDVTQKFEGELEFSVNGSLLATAIKAIKDPLVKCSIDGRTLVLKSAKSRFSLPITMPRNKLVLPPLPPIVGRVDATQFRNFLNHTISITSDDMSTPSLTVVHFVINPQDSTIKLMSTDKYKLMIRTLPYDVASDAGHTEEFSIDVDAKSLKTLLAELGDEMELTLYASSTDDNRQLGIATSTQIGMVVLRDVQAVNFKKFANWSFSNTLVFKRSELTQAISVTKSLIDGGLKTADLIISADAMSITSPMTDIDLEITSSNFEEEMDIHINLDYLGPLLAAGRSEFLGFNTDGAKSPIIIREMSDKDTVDNHYFSLVMPLSKPR